MYFLDNDSGVSTMPPVGEVISATPRWFTESPPSYPGAAWFNIVQAELLNALSENGVTPDKSKLNQLATIISGKASINDTRLTNALNKEYNLSDLTDKSGARSNLGLRAGALCDIGSSAGTVAAGDDFRLTNALNKQYNLADLTNAEGARGNLGLGTAAVKNSGSAPGQIPDMSFFASSPLQNGWQKLPSGMIIQWMNATMAGGTSNTISFPIPFPSWFLADAAISGSAGVVISGVGGSSSARVYHCTGSGTINFTAICIGY